MKKILVTEKQLRTIGESYKKELNENHIKNENNSNFLEKYYGIGEGKKATIHHKAAQGTTKKVNYKDGAYDTGDVKNRISLNNYYDTNGGDNGMEILKQASPSLYDISGDEYIFVDYSRRGKKGIRVNVVPKDYEKEMNKSSEGNFINYVNKDTLERVFDGSNIFVGV